MKSVNYLIILTIMSSLIRKETSNGVWKEKLINLLKRSDNKEDIEEFLTVPSIGFGCIPRRSSKFMKFFKNENASEEDGQTSAGESTSQECDYGFFRKGSNSSTNSNTGNFVLPLPKTKLTNFLKNGWEVSILTQRDILFSQILKKFPRDFLCVTTKSRSTSNYINPNNRIKDSFIPFPSSSCFSKNFYLKCN